MMHFKYPLAVLAATTVVGNATLITVDNLDLPTPNISGAQSNYSVQSFTPDVAGIGTSDTVAANVPLAASVFLLEASFIKTPDNGIGTAGLIFIDVYLGDGNDGVYVGSSSSSVDFSAFGASETVSWSFSSLVLDSSAEYGLVFSTDGVAGGVAVARLTAANNGAGFTNTYDGGTADDTADNSSPVAFDSRFQVRYDSVPEPATAVLLAGGLGFLLLRRRF